jgi:hypothetical protein
MMYLQYLVIKFNYAFVAGVDAVVTSVLFVFVGALTSSALNVATGFAADLGSGFTVVAAFATGFLVATGEVGFALLTFLAVTGFAFFATLAFGAASAGAALLAAFFAGLAFAGFGLDTGVTLAT